MSPEAEAAPPVRFSFKRLVVERAVFEMVERATLSEGESKPESTPIGLQLGTTLRINPELKQGALSIDVKVLPDRKWQPYRIEVFVTAVFAAAPEVPTETLAEFCRVGGPSILFPYIREMIHRMTMDAPDGPLRMDPVNLTALVNEKPWVPMEGPTGATEPPPPSAQ